MEKITVSGRFFMEGPRKWRAFGASYGPFRPNAEGDPFPDHSRTAEDFRQMRSIGLNTIRVYHVPPGWLMDLAAESGIRLMVTLPWPRRGLFLESGEMRGKIERDIVAGARALSGHKAVFACVVDNEMAPDLARWFGPAKVSRYLDHLIELVKAECPDLLVTYAGYPPTEYLTPDQVDFLTFNVYLHDRASFRAYLQRLHNLAGDKPLLIGEFGINVLAEGEETQADILSWHIEEVVRSGASGTLFFCWTDEWFTGGHEILDWGFGLVDRDRRPRLVCERLPSLIPNRGESPAQHYPPPWQPKVSVIVCTYNGSRTMQRCIESLQRLHYPDYEVIVVDDGSTDATSAILDAFTGIRVIRQQNLGLSAARNRGAQEASGEILAYTDDDCMPDEDWLYHLVETFIRGGTAMVGGPNLPPPARNSVEAAVAAAPGAPTHVLLSDQEAEHVPGCNMAVTREAFLQVGGFDPVYRKAGDDVDFCWRILEQGLKIGFDPSAIVWHHRRSTIGDYFKQQRGYGEAEAILRYQHPNVFDRSGQAIWSGVIYDRRTSSFFPGPPLIYHGIFALGYFQSIYRRPEAVWRGMVAGLPWFALTVLVLMLGLMLPILRIVPVLMMVATLVAALVTTLSTRIEPGFGGLGTRLLLYYLTLLQPLSRAWARYFTWLEKQRTPPSVSGSRTPALSHWPRRQRPHRLAFWAEPGQSRLGYLQALQSEFDREGWRTIPDTGWSNWDIHVLASRWWHVYIRSVAEVYPEQKELIHLELRLRINSFTWLMSLPAVIAGLILIYWLPVCGIAVAAGFLAAVIMLLINGRRLQRRLGQTALAAADTCGLLIMDNGKRTSG